MEKKSEKIQTGLRIPIEQYERIRNLCDRSGVTVNSLILQAVDIGLSRIEETYHTETVPCSFS